LRWRIVKILDVGVSTDFNAATGEQAGFAASPPNT
jgi:hypothetical protein